MISITWKSEEYLVKSKLSELTVGEFEDINMIFREKIYNVDKWVEVINMLTEIPHEEIETWPTTLFQSLVDQLFEYDELGEPLTEIQLGDETLVAREEMTIRDIHNFEKIFFNNEPNLISKIIAISFSESKTPQEVIEARAQEIRNLPASNLLSYMKNSLDKFFEYIVESNPVKFNATNVETV